MTEGTGVGAAKLGSGETREGDDRGEGGAGDTGRRKVDTKDRARKTARRAEGTTVIGRPTASTSPFKR